jgi:hypothetical protein
MQTVEIVLFILSLLVMVLTKWFDRKFYPSANFKDEDVPGRFFDNFSYDEPVNRFLLSKGGMLLCLLFFLTVMAVSIFSDYTD